MSGQAPDIQRLQAREDDEWLQLMHLYGGRLYAYIARRVPDAQAREDVLQEVFLGAIKGILTFDPAYSLEQFLFGICRNRTIDYLRRVNPAGRGPEPEGAVSVAGLAADELSPSSVFRRGDLHERGRALLVDVLREWVQETWDAGEFTRLIVIEALITRGLRNLEVQQLLGLRDESVVAGIKFRSLKRLHELAARAGGSEDLLRDLSEMAADTRGVVDVGEIWKAERVSCPATHWVARALEGQLEAGPRGFVEFHTSEGGCAWCRAAYDDLQRSDVDLAPIIERVGESTLRVLRSRSSREGPQ